VSVYKVSILLITGWFFVGQGDFSQQNLWSSRLVVVVFGK